MPSSSTYKKPAISSSVIKRLPRYRRFLRDLRADGITRISSKDLAHRMNLTASQIRQDLNCFGGFGLQGYGYNVDDLYREIGAILGLDKCRPTILLGAGNLGKAIARQLDFKSIGFDLIGIFDKSPEIIGREIRDLTVADVAELKEFCMTNRPEAAILCIPSSQVTDIADMLVELGVKGFW
ncbi:MAG: redox-sensing transcriptional repressor Rex, partial [Oscillospiraceae bacterium]|nr:redox-sensing transcriptional repressor Rex [Oscillospiraceae bacterium]